MSRNSLRKGRKSSIVCWSYWRASLLLLVKTVGGTGRYGETYFQTSELYNCIF